MYVIRESFGRKWMPLAWVFAIAGMFGTLPVFQINQLAQILCDVLAVPDGIATADDHFGFDLIMGLFLLVLLFSIAVGKVKRVSVVAGKLVPTMVVFCFFINAAKIPAMFLVIFQDAFTGEAAAGGTFGAVILIGVHRGVFSNETGPGTESLAHGAVKTNEPAREGLATMVVALGTTTVLTYSYYGSKRMGFLFGTADEKYYSWGYMRPFAGVISSTKIFR